MSTMRVLHLKGFLASDGATAVEYSLAGELSPDIAFDWLMEGTSEEAWKERFRRIGSRLYQIQYPKTGKKRILLKYRAYRDFFREHPYEAIHIDTDGFHRTVELFAAKRAGIRKRIVHSHNTEAEVAGRLGGSGFSRRLGQRLYTWLATDCLACSDQAGEWLFGSGTKNNVVLLKNGIDVERFRFDPQKRGITRQQLGLENKKVIGHVGRFESQKNHRFLLSVFQELYGRDQEYRLLLVGDGSLRREIMEEVRGKGLDQVILFIGNTEQVEAYYQAMDVFLLPSLHEGLSLAAVEAQCSGLPCLMADTVSTQTRLTGACGFLSLELGPALWAEKTEEAIAGSRDREEGAREVAAAGYDIHSSGEALRAIYRG